MEQTSDKVTCTKCGRPTQFPQGYLSEDQRAKYVCEACLSSPVAENQVQHNEMHSGGRRVLTEDLPQGIND